MARRAFAQESLKSVTSPTSVGLLTFWYTFFHIKICLRTGSRGHLFYPLFYDRLCYLKQYRTFRGKKWSKLSVTQGRSTHGRTDRRTSKFEASCTKARRAISRRSGTCRNRRLDYTCRARWPEGLLRRRASKLWRQRRQLVKHPQKASNLGVPRMLNQVMISPGLLTFWHTFFHIKICLRTGSRGTPHFSIFFTDRLGYLKQYCRYQCPKSGPNWWQRTDERTNRRTSKIWGLLHKSPSGNKLL